MGTPICENNFPITKNVCRQKTEIRVVYNMRWLQSQVQPMMIPEERLYHFQTILHI